MINKAINLFNNGEFGNSQADFKSTIETLVNGFELNGMCKALNVKTIRMEHYRNLLMAIFHQVYSSSSTFALAASNLEVGRELARDYLFKHADEEKSHWTWIINDLKNIGYNGPDPRNEFPSEPCQAYIAFNFYVAQKMPIARLAIALMLESIGAGFGKKYATELCKQLKLRHDQATFFFGHGDTDIGHSQAILDVLDKCELTPYEWGWMTYAAETAFKMYCRMYDEAAK